MTARNNREITTCNKVGQAGTHSEQLPLDDASRAHLWKLLHSWLTSLQIPTSPWSTIFLRLLLHLYDHMATSHGSSQTNGIWIEPILEGSPYASCFLKDTFQGIQILPPNASDSFAGWPEGCSGGTFRLVGLRNKDVQEMVAVLVQVLCNLRLEAHVMCNHRIPLRTTLAQEDSAVLQQKRQVTPIPKVTKSGLLDWLFRRPSGRHNRDAPRLNNADHKHYGEHPNTSTHSVATVKKKLLGPFKKDSSSITSVTHDDSNDPKRCSRLVGRLEGVVISSSPGCVYPMPPFLKRLAQEEGYLEKLAQEQEDAEHDPPSFRSYQRLRRRTASLLSHSSTRLKKNRDIFYYVSHLSPAIVAYTSVLHKTLDLSGLQELTRATLKGYKEAQYLIVLYMCYSREHPELPCVRPHMRRMDMLGCHGGRTQPSNTLYSILQRWADQASHRCCAHQGETEMGQPVSQDSDDGHPVPTTRTLQCEALMLDHLITFGHGESQVVVEFSPAEAQPSEPGVQIWMSCSECGATTEKLPMSLETGSCPLGKYLEIMFYSTRFTVDLCRHTRTLFSTSLRRCFRVPTTDAKEHIIIQLRRQPLTILDIRGPSLHTLQIQCDRPRFHPNTVRRWLSEIEHDVDQFFGRVQHHFDLLGHYLRGELKQLDKLVEDSDEQVVLDRKEKKETLQKLERELGDLKKALLSDHREWVHALYKTAHDDLNEYRRAFAAQSVQRQTRLTQWQQANCPELIADWGLDPPDYIRLPTVHAMPESSILVREDEPTSLIAYTLSCFAYVKEMTHGTASTPLLECTRTLDTPDLLLHPLLTDCVESHTSEMQNLDDAGSKEPTTHTDIYTSQFGRIARKRGPISSESEMCVSDKVFLLTTYHDIPRHQRIRKTTRFTMQHQFHHDWHGRHHPLPTVWDRKHEIQIGTDFWQVSERTISEIHKDSTTQQIKEKVLYAVPPDVPMDSEPPPNTQRSSHIKHNELAFSHANTEFTCIVYFADEFEALRRQCGIDQVLIESLSRCQPWYATGGKSKSRFYKTQDDRFVIKEMLSSWNVDEKDEFLNFAPAYFEHLRQEAPSLLVKIFGFYTLRMVRLTDKKTVWNLDVMVMENLFYGLTVSQRFDFKGIRERQLARNHDNATRWDKEWLQDYRLSFPVPAHSLAFMERAIQRDTEFLSNGNVMDYSLLVGVDATNKVITTGIVDFIGTYTWYKKIESKSKSTLSPNKQVTILPPEQYRARFCREIASYFVAVPGIFDSALDAEPNRPQLYSSASERGP